MGFKAFWLLAFHFWKHVFMKITFRYDAGGERRFVANYRADRLLPIEPSTREVLPRWHACIACGICDAVYDAPGVSVMSVVSSGVRDFSAMADSAADAATLVDVARLEAAAAACPTGVPIADVVAYVAGTVERLERAA